jgi:hypothetical protein
VETEKAVYVANEMDASMRLWAFARYGVSPLTEQYDGTKVIGVSRLR